MAEGIAAPAWGVVNRDTPLLTKFGERHSLSCPVPGLFTLVSVQSLRPAMYHHPVCSQRPR